MRRNSKYSEIYRIVNYSASLSSADDKIVGRGEESASFQFETLLASAPTALECRAARPGSAGDLYSLQVEWKAPERVSSAAGLKYYYVLRQGGQDGNGKGEGVEEPRK